MPPAPPAPTAAPPATTSGQALQNLQGFQGSMQSPDQMVQNAQQSVGVGAAQQQVSGLRQAITNTTNLLNNVQPSVMGRTENSLVTSAQANKQIQNEQAPISQELQKQSGDLANASDDLKTLLSQADSITQLKEAGQTQQLQALKDIYDSLSAKEQQAFAQQNTQAANTLEQQKLAEQTREANQSNSLEQQKLNDSKNTFTPAQVQQQDMAGAAQYLNGLKGGDGHVSQQTWNNAMQQWLNAGYKAPDFVKQFQAFINPRYAGYHGYN